MILTNVFSNVMYLKNVKINQSSNEIGDEEKTTLLSNNIYHINVSLYCLFSHGYFFFVSFTKNSKEMWILFKDIEEQLNFKEEFYRKCRKAVIFGTSTVLLV